MMAATKMQSLAKLSGSFALGGLISQSLAREDSFLSEVVQHLNPLQPRVAHTLALTLRSTQRAPRLVPFYGIDDFGRAVKVRSLEILLLKASLHCSEHLKVLQSANHIQCLDFAYCKAQCKGSTAHESTHSLM